MELNEDDEDRLDAVWTLPSSWASEIHNNTLDHRDHDTRRSGSDLYHHGLGSPYTRPQPLSDSEPTTITDMIFAFALLPLFSLFHFMCVLLGRQFPHGQGVWTRYVLPIAKKFKILVFSTCRHLLPVHLFNAPRHIGPITSKFNSAHAQHERHTGDSNPMVKPSRCLVRNSCKKARTFFRVVSPDWSLTLITFLTDMIPLQTAFALLFREPIQIIVNAIQVVYDEIEYLYRFQVGWRDYAALPFITLAETVFCTGLVTTVLLKNCIRGCYTTVLSSQTQWPVCYLKNSHGWFRQKSTVYDKLCDKLTSVSGLTCYALSLEIDLLMENLNASHDWEDIVTFPVQLSRFLVIDLVFCGLCIVYLGCNSVYKSVSSRKRTVTKYILKCRHRRPRCGDHMNRSNWTSNGSPQPCSSASSSRLFSSDLSLLSSSSLPCSPSSLSLSLSCSLSYSDSFHEALSRTRDTLQDGASVFRRSSSTVKQGTVDMARRTSQTGLVAVKKTSETGSRIVHRISRAGAALAKKTSQTVVKKPRCPYTRVLKDSEKVS